MTSYVGQMMTIKIHKNNLGVVVFDSVTFVDITHVPGYTPGDPVVYKIDYVGSPNDAYMIQYTAAEGAPFADFMIAELIAMAVAAVGGAELAGTLLTITPLLAGSGYFTAPGVTLLGGGFGGLGNEGRHDEAQSGQEERGFHEL